MSERRFDGQVAVITGAGRGLGRAYALLLAGKGATVVVNDPGSALNDEGADEGIAAQVVREIRNAGGTAVEDMHSVATKAGGDAIIKTALDRYGRVDILIHNAGNVRYGAIDTISYEDFRAVIDVHLLGAFHVAAPAFRALKTEGYGRVVLTSSIGGLYSIPDGVNYAISKSGTSCSISGEMLIAVGGCWRGPLSQNHRASTGRAGRSTRSPTISMQSAILTRNGFFHCFPQALPTISNEASTWRAQQRPAERASSGGSAAHYAWRVILACAASIRGVSFSWAISALMVNCSGPSHMAASSLIRY